MKIPPSVRFFIRWITRLHIFLFRLTRGRIGGTLMRVPVLLLTTRGRRTGKRFTSPLYYLAEQGVWYVVASYAGSDVEPAWWSNLKKNPRAWVEIPGFSFEATARQVDEETKQRLWPRFVAMYAPYQQYQDRTTRDIPIVALEAVSAP